MYDFLLCRKLYWNLWNYLRLKLCLYLSTYRMVTTGSLLKGMAFIMAKKNFKYLLSPCIKQFLLKSGNGLF